MYIYVYFLVFIELYGMFDAQHLSGKFGEIWAKFFRTPKNMPTPTPVWGCQSFRELLQNLNDF